MSIEQTLAERGKRYGDFGGHAMITQGLKLVMAASPGWAMLSSFHREALEMIAHKIGRILNGDPNYADSWHDIAGYARLVEGELTKQLEKQWNELTEQVERPETQDAKDKITREILRELYGDIEERVFKARRLACELTGRVPRSYDETKALSDAFDAILAPAKEER